MENNIAEFAEGVGANVCAAVDEAFASDFAKGRGGDEFGEDDTANIFKANAHFAKYLTYAVDADFVRFVVRVVTILVESFAYSYTDRVVCIVSRVSLVEVYYEGRNR